MTGNLILGDHSGASGSYTLSGTGSLSVVGVEYIGESGRGAFTQSGGTNAVAFTWATTAAPAATVHPERHRQPSAVAGSETVGNSGSGAFTQSGGTNSITAAAPGGLILGNDAGSSGTIS